MRPRDRWIAYRLQNELEDPDWEVAFQQKYKAQERIAILDMDFTTRMHAKRQMTMIQPGEFYAASRAVKSRKGA